MHIHILADEAELTILMLFLHSIGILVKKYVHIYTWVPAVGKMLSSLVPGWERDWMLSYCV